MSLQTAVKVEPGCAATPQSPVKEEIDIEVDYHELDLVPLSFPTSVISESAMLATGTVNPEVMLDFDCKLETNLDSVIESELTEDVPECKLKLPLIRNCKEELDSVDADCDNKSSLSVQKDILDACAGASVAPWRSCTVRLARHAALATLRPGDRCRWTARDTLDKLNTEPCKTCHSIPSLLLHHQSAERENELCSDCTKRHAITLLNNIRTVKTPEVRYLISERQAKKKSFNCNICKLNFFTPQGFERHKKVHRVVTMFPKKHHSVAKFPKKPLRIPKPRTNPTSRDIIVDNLIVVRNLDQKVYTCEVCKETFYNSVEFREHKLRHINLTQKGYKCDLCKRSYARVTDLNKHKNFYHKRAQFTNCDACEARKALRQLRMMTNPNEKEEEEKPYFCDFCDLTRRIHHI